MIDPAQPVDVDLDWLRNELTSLKDLRQIAELAYDPYALLVVIAFSARA
jgi:hypothetical protein